MMFVYNIFYLRDSVLFTGVKCTEQVLRGDGRGYTQDRTPYKDYCTNVATKQVDVRSLCSP